MKRPRLGALGAIFGVLCLLSLDVSSAAPAVSDSGHALCTVPAAKPDDKAVPAKAKKQALAHLDRARKAYESRQFGEALYELRAAYDLNPLVDVLFNLAQVCREAGREQEALALYEQTLSQTTDATAKEDAHRHIDTLRFKLSAAADQQAAQALLKSDYAGAISAWETAYRLSKQPSSLFHIAESYRLNNQIPEALAGYGRFLEAAPNDPGAPKAKEQIALLRAGQEDARATQLADKKLHRDAIAAWEAAYQLAPRPLYLYRMAESQRQLGERGPATRNYERYLRESTADDPPELRLSAERHLAQFRQSALDDAQRLTRKVEKPVYKKWWFWTIIGGVAVAAVAGGVAGALLSAKPVDPFTDIPIGNQRSLTPQ